MKVRAVSLLSPSAGTRAGGPCSAATGGRFAVWARSVANATGPWAGIVRSLAGAKHEARLVKGSPIAVRKPFDRAHPNIIQGGDGCVSFDDRAERASEVTRDDVLAPDREPAPMLSVYGGKVTTGRRFAEQAVDMPARPLGIDRPGWTHDAPLPGGDIPVADIAAFEARRAARHSWLQERLLRHFTRHYGTEAHAELAACGCAEPASGQISKRSAVRPDAGSTGRPRSP